MLSSNLTVEDEEAVQEELRALQREAVSSCYCAPSAQSDHRYRSWEKSPSGRSSYRLRRTPFPSSPFPKKLSRSQNLPPSANEYLYQLEDHTSGGSLLVHILC